MFTRDNSRRGALRGSSNSSSRKSKARSTFIHISKNPHGTDACRILIVLDLEVLSHLGEQEKIGQPVALDGNKDDQAQEPPKPAAQQQQQQQQPNGISTNGFYGAKQEPRSQTLPTRSNQNPSKADSSYGNIYPIEALSPYAHKWTIKARCTHKSDIKTWHNKNGEGKLFSTTFLDESGEIRATGFNADCDRLYELFQEGGVYYISAPCRVQMAKKQFNNTNNDYELTFERDTVVEKAEDQSGAPQVRYNFTQLSQLETVEANSTIDVIGVIREVGEVSQITSKTTSKPYDKRELTLADNSNYTVRLTIWGNTATSFDAQPESVVAFKGVKVSDFGGRSLSLLSSGTMSVDPDIDDAHRLKGWYDAQGKQEDFKTHAAQMGASTASGRSQQCKTIAAVRDEGLGMNEDNADYFSVKATVVFVKQDTFAYAACRTEGCSKKVVEIETGNYRCERCDKSWDKPEYRYVLTVNVSDFTGQIWLSCFDDVGRLLIGASATEVTELKENDEKAFTEKIAQANCKSWIFRCRAKMDTFQDQQRVRYQVSGATPIDYARESAKLADLIKQYSIEDSNSLFVQ